MRENELRKWTLTRPPKGPKGTLTISSPKDLRKEGEEKEKGKKKEELATPLTVGVEGGSAPLVWDRPKNQRTKNLPEPRTKAAGPAFVEPLE